jgi:hypothetical protein
MTRKIETNAGKFNNENRIETGLSRAKDAKATKIEEFYPFAAFAVFARNRPLHFLNSHSSSVRSALKIRQVTMGK